MEWIWYPGDFEIWLGNIFNNRRTERGVMFPPFWKQDSHWQTVEFTKVFTLEQEEQVKVFCEGRFNISIDGQLQHDPIHVLFENKRAINEPFGIPLIIPAGTHRLSLKVWNPTTPPAIYIRGEHVRTDATWQVTYEDKIWIDENGVAHGSGIYVPVGHWNFNQPGYAPSKFRLDTERQEPVSSEAVGKGVLYDFGRETFGKLVFNHPTSDGLVLICYGESREEALDRDHCETLDYCSIHDLKAAPLGSKAFRYVYIETGGAAFESLSMHYEYAYYTPKHSGSFRCSDEELNRIWDVAAYTMDLTTREFFVDGIKRDRWTWSGDAIQSYLMNYYLRFNTPCVKRTIRQLRGKDPVTAHVNTIMDYTFYWFISIEQYYQFTGGKEFLKEMLPRMQTLMDYVESRLNEDGLAEGKPDDWIFVDWTDFPMHKRGTLCFEQILFCKALEAMSRCAEVVKEDSVSSKYAEKAASLRRKIKDLFWDEEQHAYLHAIEDGEINSQITKFPNMFAIIYGIADEDECRQIIEHVMLNPSVNAITTPYMRFYELEALCKMGLQSKVLSEIKAYWGGMLREGATTFWEKYNPEETGREHLAMYGRPYGKSLCHAWGASPIYILGRYFLGVQPTTPGYETYEVRPVLGGLDWLQGDVPTPYGLIHVEINRQEVKVYSDGGQGTLIICDQEIDIPPQKELTINIKALELVKKIKK